MTVRNLDALFQPKSIAVIGASRRPGSVGEMVWRRVIEGGFTGPLWAVNPHHANYAEGFDGRPVLSDAGDLPEAPTVAMICTRPATWPSLVHRLGGMGTRAAILVGEVRDADDHAHLRHALAAARPHLLRIVGPGSVGVITPALNAQLGAAATVARPGGVAWVSQSNALTNAVLRWADRRGLGFSHAIALGGEADVDAGDVLDYLASDPSTRAILLELDSVRAARKFMSAARAAARNKPVLALRSGRDDPGDALYTAAFRRAGMVRVDTLDDLLDEIETLGVGRVAASDTATLITSDRGVATLARDAFNMAGDTLAGWPDDARAAMRAALPHVEPGNPLVLGETATPEDFALAMQTLGPYPKTGTVFVVHGPTHSAPVEDVARTLIENQRVAYRGVLACFFGGVDAAMRDALHAHGIPVHTTPRRLARAFTRLVDYRLGRALLMQTPEGTPAQRADAIEAAQALAREALAAGQSELTGEAASKLLGLFGLRTWTPGESVTLDAVEPVVEVAVEFRDDENFGPVFHFVAPSMDGSSPPLRVYGLPPLNPTLARDIVTQSPHAHRLSTPEPPLIALTELSQAVCDVSEIVGMELTLRVLPAETLLAAPRLRLAAKRSRFAIMPYPRRLEETLDWFGQRLTIRPIRPEDEEPHRALIASMTPEDLRLRFFSAVRSFDHTQLARMTQIDYDREMALIATVEDEDGKPRTLGVVRAVTDPDNETAEFAVTVLSGLKGRGLGHMLMERIIAYARSRGTHWMLGEALRENTPMIRLARSVGFTVTPTEDPGVVGFRMPLE
ncbi:GNAT family N-acetyltransferase [Paraburkholderia dinghuensis]|uniref:GNAT family N-acetyltransferase n=1 Tax=Paraburkholderia dinghuensis TaxID=2305225 RepID=A0A3N6MA68_9BURK|nr:GNAT family N-acetyltransferase [Paraburkholderia dinghuensis]RQH00619.1 GNAT family N-acetyltransferase [Paraburkholderia dinghuensis]